MNDNSTHENIFCTYNSNLHLNLNTEWYLPHHQVSAENRKKLFHGSTNEPLCQCMDLHSGKLA